MTRYSVRSHGCPVDDPSSSGRWRLVALAAASLWLAGCAVEVLNTHAAEELARQDQPPGSSYVGWRVFQDKCAGCHGPAANGLSSAPDLLPIVRRMGLRQFVDVVLTRYDWGLPAAQAGADRAAREALVDTIVQRKGPPLVMPAWGSEPRVNAHIADLYTYLSARADGSQGPDRALP